MRTNLFETSRLVNDKGDEAIVRRGQEGEYLAAGYKITEELPASLLPGTTFSDVTSSAPARTISKSAPLDGEGPPLPGLDMEHRRKAARLAGEKRV